MTAPTIRCPLCEWTYTVPPLPAGVDETTLAGVFGPGVMLLSAINRRACVKRISASGLETVGNMTLYTVGFCEVVP